jgi:UV DNA damage repair endonuclease
MDLTRNGIVIRLPHLGKENSLIRKICDQIKSYIPFGYKMFVIEISEKDLQSDLEVFPSEKERFFYFLDDLNIRIAFYIKSKNHVVSTDLESRKNAKSEIFKIGNLIDEIDGGKFEIPLICHIGGAKGNRRKSMLEFCKFFDSLPWKTQRRICLINDEKPSLFSVKDLLSVTYIEKKIPIVFRTSSHRTNQGGLTYKESFFLAASTWAERDNPIMFYCPSNREETITVKDLNPYNLVVDVAFDNNLPDPPSDVTTQHNP